MVVGDDFGTPVMPHGTYIDEMELYVKQLGFSALAFAGQSDDGHPVFAQLCQAPGEVLHQHHWNQLQSA